MSEDGSFSHEGPQTPDGDLQALSAKLRAANARLQAKVDELEAANARLEGTVDRRTSMIYLLHHVATEANRAASIEGAITEILPHVARHFGAAYGVVWLRDEADDNVLVASGPRLMADAGRAGILHSLTPARRPIEGCPAVHSVVASGQALWTDDLEAGIGVERAAAARDLGHGLLLMLPILVGERVEGVMELVLESSEERRSHMPELATSLGTEIGRVVERIRLQRKMSDLSAEEQRRLGRELHDTVAQEIAGIRMLAETLHHRMREGTADPESAAELAEIAAQAQGHVRSFARGLVPAVIASGGLRSALEHLVERVRAETGASCEFENPDAVIIDDSDIATNLYYIAQEAVQNAVRHGDAGNIVVNLQLTDDGVLSMRIVDNGRGFLGEDVAASRGSGLRIMNYRSRLVGGSLEVASEPSRGTTVTVMLRTEPSTGSSPERGTPSRSTTS